MPTDAYGQASPVATLELNRRLLPSLTDGSAAKRRPTVLTARSGRSCWRPCFTS